MIDAVACVLELSDFGCEKECEAKVVAVCANGSCYVLFKVFKEGRDVDAQEATESNREKGNAVEKGR